MKSIVALACIGLGQCAQPILSDIPVSTATEDDKTNIDSVVEKLSSSDKSDGESTSLLLPKVEEATSPASEVEVPETDESMNQLVPGLGELTPEQIETAEALKQLFEKIFMPLMDNIPQEGGALDNGSKISEVENVETNSQPTEKEQDLEVAEIPKVEESAVGPLSMQNLFGSLLGVAGGNKLSMFNMISEGKKLYDAVQTQWTSMEEAAKLGTLTPEQKQALLADLRKYHNISDLRKRLYQIMKYAAVGAVAPTVLASMYRMAVAALPEYTGIATSGFAVGLLLPAAGCAWYTRKLTADMKAIADKYRGFESHFKNSHRYLTVA